MGVSFSHFLPLFYCGEPSSGEEQANFKHFFNVFISLFRWQEQQTIYEYLGKKTNKVFALIMRKTRKNRKNCTNNFLQN
jgi:hypothetical protein